MMTIRALADGPMLADTGSGDYESDGGVPVRMSWLDANIGWVALAALALGVAVAWFIAQQKRRKR